MGEVLLYNFALSINNYTRV